ncbi:archease [Streptomyces aidingensis]|uniref:SHS2 domain-containing protein n=1 Tax=Streptomyces aidingensis TaxID=910347 RepID=A0A1I1LL71_9ACTN|nr:archease [Streptomyces aidingensis]SFC71063.1 SHS2 domain-containing protein [Streptomyces aidingensis]
MEVRQAGHSSVPHLTDLRVLAWAPTREECLAQAVQAMTEAIADPASAGPGAATRELDTVIPALRDEDLLLGLAEEFLHWLDAGGEVPVRAEVAAVPGGVRARVRLVRLRTLRTTGPAPVAVTDRGLSIGPAPDGWHCAVTLAV